MTTPRTKPRSVSSLRGVAASGAVLAGLLMDRPPCDSCLVSLLRANRREQNALHTAETGTPLSQSGNAYLETMKILFGIRWDSTRLSCESDAAACWASRGRSAPRSDRWEARCFRAARVPHRLERG